MLSFKEYFGALHLAINIFRGVSTNIIESKKVFLFKRRQSQ